MNHETEKENFDDGLDALLDFLRRADAQTVKIIDFDRYGVMMRTAAELRDVLSENGTDGGIAVELFPMFLSGSIRVELGDLVVSNTPAFAAALMRADNFEVYPTLNGRLRLSLSFHSVLRAM